MDDLKVVRPAQLAELLNVTEVSVWRMEKRGELPPRKKFSSKCVGWFERDIREWMESRPNAAEVNSAAI